MAPPRTKPSQSFNSSLTQKPFEPFAIIKTINFRENPGCYTEDSERREEKVESLSVLHLLGLFGSFSLPTALRQPS